MSVDQHLIIFKFKLKLKQLNCYLFFKKTKSKMNSLNQVSHRLSPEDVIMQYGQYLQKKNLELILSLYHDDAEVIPEQLNSIQAKNELTPFYKNTFSSITIDGQLKITSTYQTENVAIVRCEEQAKITNLATGIITTNYFREMFVLTQTNGTWLIFKYMFSQNINQVQTES